MRIMELRNYLTSLKENGRRIDFATRCKTSIGHLRNVSYGKLCGEDLAMRIDQESGGLVTVEELRPDLYPQWSYLRHSKRKAA